MPLDSLPNALPDNEFFGPNSSLTPGVAGSLTMLFSNFVHNAMGWPILYAGLAFSVLFALAVIDASLMLPKRLLFFVFNTMTILCFAIGSGTVAYRAEAGAARSTASIGAMFISPAAAQASPLDAQIKQILDNPNLGDAQKKQMISELIAPPAAPLPSQSQIFNPWLK